MKNIVFFFAFVFVSLFFVQRSDAQCYVRLEDASGFNTDEYQDSLQAAAAKLCAIFDSTGFAGQFKVYDFGFYLHQENTTGGYPEPFAQKLAEVQGLSPYYLLFGKQTDKSGVYTKFWVDLVLPDTGKLSCLDSISLTLRDEIIDKIKISTNIIYEELGNSQDKYSQLEIAVIDSLTQILDRFLSCCDYQPRGGGTCSTCIFTQEEIFQKLLDNDFVINFVKINSDTDFGNRSDSRAYQSANFNASVSLLDIGGGGSLDTLVLEAQNYFPIGRAPSLGAVTFQKYKYPRDCAKSFESELASHLSSNSEVSVFLVLLNFDNNYGVLAYHIVSNNPARPNGDEELTMDELTEVGLDLSEAGGSCSRLVSSWLNKSVADNMLSCYGCQGLIADPKYRKFVDEFQQSAKAKYYESSYAFGIDYDREFAIVKNKEYNNCFFFCDYRIQWTTTVNLCGNVIHNVLDACGLIPGPGEICDAFNGIIYLVEGDFENAGYSAGALIPIVGNASTGAKHLAYMVKFNNVKRYFKAIPLPNGLINFGERDKLRKIMNLPTGEQAHHIIPWNLCGHNENQMEMIRKVTASTWHPSHPLFNGKAVKEAFPNGKKFHDGSHPKYNDFVQNQLEIMLTKMSNSGSLNDPNKLMQNITLLTSTLSTKLDEAWAAGKSINEAASDWKFIIPYQP